MKIFLFLFLLAPLLEGWELLSSVDLERKYDEFTGQETDVPVFNETLRNAEGSKMTLTGYVIPLEANKNSPYFILSRYPYQSCFFCGAAGPETVVEVYASDPVNFPMDQRIRVEGTFKLNENDPLHLFYILEDASVEIPD